MKSLKILFVGLLMVLFGSCKPSLPEPKANNRSCNFPDRIGFVNDYVNLLTAEEIERLEQTIANFSAKTGTEIIIVVEDSKKSHSRKFHCPQGIAHQWKLATPDKFDGFLIAISKKRNYVDFTYGLKFNHKLTPKEHNNLLYEIVLPAFKRKAYYDGLQLGIDYFISRQANDLPITKNP